MSLENQEESHFSKDSLLSRLKNSVTRAAAIPDETESRINSVEVSVRKSVRELARSRVSLALRQLRAVYGLSYEDIHERTGLSAQLLFDIEYKQQRLTLDELKKLVSCYDLTASDLLGVDIDEDEHGGDIRTTLRRIGRGSTGVDSR